MAVFNYTGWGNGLIGRWVLETGESGIYRGQCTQVVSQLLKDLGYSGWQAARGNGNQVGPYMVAHSEAVFVGTNLAAIPTNEIHVICKDVGNPFTAGHVSVAASGDVVYEQNVTISGLPTRNYGAGPTYPFRLGRLTETFRGVRYHYKITVPSDYDNITGDPTDDPTDDPEGPNQNRFLRKRIITIDKFKGNKRSSIENRKNYPLVPTTSRNLLQG